MDTVQVTTTYTFEELRLELDKRRKRGMPRSTLYSWLDKLSIAPNVEGFYSIDDLEELKALSRYLSNGGSRIDNFKLVYKP
jgi:hypothetical protein